MATSQVLSSSSDSREAKDWVMEAGEGSLILMLFDKHLGRGIDSFWREIQS